MPSSSDTIGARHSPPGRTSIAILSSGAENPFGPHQFVKCFGSVQALYTLSRGASKVYLIVTPLDSVIGSSSLNQECTGLGPSLPPHRPGVLFQSAILVRLIDADDDAGAGGFGPNQLQAEPGSVPDE